MAKNNYIDVATLKEYMLQHYGYITVDLTDKEIQSFLDRSYVVDMGSSILMVADTFSDYLLANGAEAIE
jgi:hypothetical protein